MIRPKKERNFEIPLSMRISPKVDGELAKETERVGMSSKSSWVRFIIMNRRNDTVRKILRNLKE